MGSALSNRSAPGGGARLALIGAALAGFPFLPAGPAPGSFPPATAAAAPVQTRPSPAPDPNQFRPQSAGFVADGESPDLALHFTSEVMGWMEPCG